MTPLPLSHQENSRKKIITATLSLALAIFLSLIKFVFAYLTGSLGILSSAIDNIGDIAMSSVSLMSIRKSAEPPDKSHPYGHGKIETLAAAFQVAIITIIGIGIIAESVRRYIKGRILSNPDAGIGVMVVSIVASFIAAKLITKVGEETDSAALMADAVHFKTDVYSGSGILIALLLVRMTGISIFDSLAGLVVGILVIKEAIPLLKGVLDDLSDRELPEDVKVKINEIIDKHRPMVVDVHAMRTRKAGSMKHIDFHLVVCKLSNVQEAHRLAEHLEMEIEEALGEAHVVTHIDPCGIECPEDGECVLIREQMMSLRAPRKDRDREKYYFEE